MNEEKNRMPSQSETPTRGNPSQMSSSNEKLECLRDMIDILLSLSDEEWQCLMQGMEYNHHQKKCKLEFAALCTKIVTNVSRSVNSSIPTMTDGPRTDSVHPEKTEQSKGKRKFKAKHTSRSTADMERGLTDDLKTPLSGERSPADQSDVICDNLENIFSEVKMAMREAICRVASGKTSSSGSSMGNALFSPLANEVLKALSVRRKHSPSAEISESKVFDLRKTQMPDTEAVTGKIVMIVLDLMEGNSGKSFDLKETSDLLIAAAERIKLMTSAVNSEEDLTNKTGSQKKAHLSREDLKIKSSRAVSLVLLSSTGNRMINGRSCKSFSSPASELDQDTMLKKREPSETTNDPLRSHLDSSVTEIVDTIVENMDALSAYSMSCPSLESDHSLTSGVCKDCGICSVTNAMLHTVHQKVKDFINMSKTVMDSVTETLTKISAPKQSGSEDLLPLLDEPSIIKSASETSELSVDEQVSTLIRPASVSQLDHLTLTCTNDIVGGIVQLYHADVSQPKPCTSAGSSEISLVSPQEIHQVMQELEKLVTISRSSSEKSSPGRDQEDFVSVPAESVSIHEEAVLSPRPSSELTERLLSNQFQDNVTEFVSDILTKTEEKLSLQTFRDVKTESPTASSSSLSSAAAASPSSLPSPSSSVFVHETTSCIITTFLKWFKKFSSSDHPVTDDFRKPPLSKRYNLSARKIYRDVRKRVFEFVSRLQQSHFKESDSDRQCLLKASHQLTEDKTPPTVQEDVDACSDEAMYKILELYKDQEVLAKAVDVVSDTECKKSSPRSDPSSQIHLDPDMWTSSSESVIAVLNTMDSLDESSVLCSDSPSLLIARDEFSVVSSTASLIASDISEGKSHSPSFSMYKKMQTYFHAFFTSYFRQHCSLKFKGMKVFPVLDGSTSRESAPLTLEAASLLNETDLSASLTSTVSDGVFQLERPAFSTNSGSAGSNVSKLVRDAAASTTQSSAESEKINDRVVEISISEDGTISERSAPTAGTVEATKPLFQEDSDLTQLENLIPDETIHSCAHAATEFTANILQTKTSGPSDVCLSSSDLAPESSQRRKILLRDSVLFSSALVYLFTEESTKHFLLRLSSDNPTLSPGTGSSQVTSTAFSDRNMPHSSAETQLQNLITVQSADHQHVFTDAVNRFAETLVDKVREAFHPKTRSSQANSSVVKETPLNVSISNQNLPARSDPSLLNHSSCMDTAPGDVKKKSRRICFGVRRKFPFISFGLKKKKENQLSPLRTTSDSHRSSSISGETSWREPEGCTSSKKPHKLLPRIFSAISKAVRNSFKPKST